MIRIIQLAPPLWGLQSSNFSEVLRRAAKSTPGLEWSPPHRAWIGYSDSIYTAASRLQVEASIQVAGMPPGVGVGIATMPVAEAGLRDYQKEGVAFLLAKAEEGALLADEVGLGKSATAITVMRALKRKAVVVCPNFVRGVWVDELKKWWPAAIVSLPVGTKADESYTQALPIDVVVIHYDILHAWAGAIKTWGPNVLVIDEGQYCQSATSRRTKAVAAVAETCKFRMMLTGTPMTSRPRDLWAPVNVISPGRFGKKFFTFGVRYAGGHQEQVTPTKAVWKFDGSTHTDELKARLNFTPDAPWGFMLRRTKTDVQLQLPAKTRQIIHVEVQKRFVTPMAKAIKSDAVLRQALNLSADGKFPQVVEAAVAHLEQNRKVVIGCWRKDVAARLAIDIRQKVDCYAATITGDTPTTRRHEIIAKRPDLLTCTIDATAEGINLSHADVAMVAELIWVPAKIIQWEGRFARFGGSNVLIQYFVAKNSVDSLVRAAVLDKLETFQQAIGHTDDGLHADLTGQKEDALTRLQKLYERMKSEE